MHRAAPARPACAGLPDGHKLFLQLISPVPAPPRVQRRHVKGWCLGHAAPKATSCPSDSIHPAAGTGLYQEAAPSSASSQGNSILQSQASTAGHGLCRRAAPQPHHSHQQTRAAQHPTQKHEGYSKTRSQAQLLSCTEQWGAEATQPSWLSGPGGCKGRGSEPAPSSPHGAGSAVKNNSLMLIK